MTVGLLTNTKGRLVPLQNTLKRTKQLDISGAITCSPTATSVNRAVAIFYADSTGTWRMSFNINVSVASASRASATVTIAGVVFKTGPYQAIEAFAGGSPTFYQAYAVFNTGNISYQHSTATTDYYVFSGDVELNADPQTYTTTANLENYGDVTAWFPMADASTPGLLSTSAQTKSGVMTFIDGIKIGNNETLLVYDEYLHTGTTTGAIVDGTYNVRLVKIGKSITCEIPAVTSNGQSYNTTLNLGTLPSGWWPQAAVVLQCMVADRGTNTSGAKAQINTNGTIICYKDVSNSLWTAGAAGPLSGMYGAYGCWIA